MDAFDIILQQAREAGMVIGGSSQSWKRRAADDLYERGPHGPGFQSSTSAPVATKSLVEHERDQVLQFAQMRPAARADLKREDPSGYQRLYTARERAIAAADEVVAAARTHADFTAARAKRLALEFA